VGNIYQFCDGFYHTIDPFSNNEFTRGRKQRKHGDGTRITVNLARQLLYFFRVNFLSFSLIFVVVTHSLSHKMVSDLMHSTGYSMQQITINGEFLCIGY